VPGAAQRLRLEGHPSARTQREVQLRGGCAGLEALPDVIIRHQSMILPENHSSGYQTGQPGFAGDSIDTASDNQSADAHSGCICSACAIQS